MMLSLSSIDSDFKPRIHVISMIYLITHYYWPESNPPANRFGQIAGILVEKYGSDSVRVITGRPNHPDGKLAKGFKWRLFRRWTGPSQEQVLNLYEIPAANRGFYRKTLGFISFGVSVFLFFLFKRLRSSDVIYVTSPPSFPLYAIWLLKKLKKRNLRYTAEIRDLMPQIVAGMGHMQKGTPLYQWLLNLSHRNYQDAERVIGVVEGICDYIKAVVPPNRVSLIYNSVDAQSFAPCLPSDTAMHRREHPDVFQDSSRTTFLFAGYQSRYMDLMSVLEVLDGLRRKTPDFRFILIGYGDETERLKVFVKDHAMGDHVIFLPYMSREELLKWVNATDFCFSSTIEAEIYKMVIPCKVLEYMACDKFVVASHDCPFARKLEEEGHALVSLPGDQAALESNLLKVMRNKDRYLTSSGHREFILRDFDRIPFAERIRELFDELLEG